MILATVAFAGSLTAGPAHDLRIGEGFVDPLGFHDASPSFSWKLPEGTNAQSAYQIVVGTSPSLLPDSPDLWDSGKVASDRSAWLAYGGKSLDSRQQLHWQVKFWDQDGNESPWSEPARFEIGLLDPSDWTGRWIRMEQENPVGADATAEVTIEKASYGVPDDAGKSIDLTAKLRDRLASGKPVVVADNALAGRDPVYGVPKSLSLVLMRDGLRVEMNIPENQSVDLRTGKQPEPPAPFVPQHLRRDFTLGKTIRSARLHVTAKGLYEIRINGSKVGRDFMAPGWTPYAKKIETLTYDVTGGLRKGANVIGAILGEGWYAGRLGWGSHEAGHAKPELLLQLEIKYDDDSSDTIVSDGAWKATDRGPIRFSGIYDGETYDARMEMPGWDKPGYDDSGWKSVIATPPAADERVAPKRHHPVRIVKEVTAKSVNEPTPGRFVFDLGQNIVGWPKLRIPVRKDQTVTVRFAEMLEKDGTLYTANYRRAKSTDHYTAAEDGTVTWHPVFTFHGFRYVELSGLPEGTKPEPGWVTGAVLHSDFGWTGRFTSSHDLLNQLQSNIIWGLRGNFLDVPTDCPQRDERLGWTGDAQVFAPAALFNSDVHSFFSSWLESMRLDQHEDGAIPNVIPNVLNDHCGGPGWADAATVVPWELFVRTGDVAVLRENFDMMRRWVGYYESQAKGGIVNITAYGDWLQPYPKSGDSKADTPPDLIGTAYFARSADLTARAARVLGRTDEAVRLENLFGSVKDAFANRFFDSSGKLTTPIETQTGYLLALGFDLLPEEKRPQAFGNLVRLVEQAGGHLGTGFLGTPLLAPTLDRFGRGDLAYGVLFKETYPSWFFSIHQGATTMWERWNSYSHADGFGNAGMNSFNHYAYGAIGQWMYERIAGLAPDPEHPGYKRFFIQPMPGGPLTEAAAELDTPYGKARSAWKLEDETMRLEAVVPPNSGAVLRLTEGAVVKENGTAKELRVSGGNVLLDLAPGEHRFEITGY
ncbi:MAG: family 78 glycoside hydrolase catalytic domain [Akkermansiaceae bacterium]|nr:family 78 glycoside hydrolase catalytic domain [Akkermansiaceae bacterium]MCP5544116.1 family 78 glycoside hydrolase catalytic domain [Akkermansiaceae bacterium]MCP5547828.1 family 78 glycoside hydrolase catalytic domain [Akkermansiaceae bacterium]